jgi:hypothetical protein
MQELVREIPDVDTLLALEPEELGAKLLFLIRKRKEKKFHPGNLKKRPDHLLPQPVRGVPPTQT